VPAHRICTLAAPAGSARPPLPSGPVTTRPIASLLEDVRYGLERVSPQQAAAVAAAGGLLVDIRPVGLRERDGEVPGARIVDRNQLEWRLDPTSPNRLAEVDDRTYEQPVVVICDEGYASSLAAASLQALGLSGATDLEGGFQAWRAAGMPVTAPGSPSPASPAVAG
jgi:rhodanese-related sulfurtransferase